MRWMVAGLAAGLALPLGLGAQQGDSWVVKPEWVQAHEEFLASDVMAGRGSATRDEQIAATYVASEFMGYGLKPAPGMKGSGVGAYIQAAEIESPQLDGHATLTAGTISLNEGADFHLLTSSGQWVTAPLAKTTGVGAVATGSAVLVTDEPGQSSMAELSKLRRSGAPMLIVVEDDSMRQYSARLGGKTRTPMGLKGETPSAGRGTIVTVSQATMDRLLKVENGASAVLAVHPQPEKTPRQTFNAIGWLAGSEPASGTILLTAHLDHLGKGTPVKGAGIYNGANDDAAGTTAVLELAHALAAGAQPRRNVLFVCYGSEEAGELGSTYFGGHPPVPLGSLIANLEFEMIGNQDPKMPKGVLLLTGWDRSNLGPTLKAHGALIGPDPYPEEHFFERSDNYALALKGVVAHTAAGWGTVPTYHQPNDDMAHLDLPFMTSAIQSLVGPVRWLATSDFKPEWNAGGRPKGRD
jgi:aminopeptidase YwaD